MMKQLLSFIAASKAYLITNRNLLQKTDHSKLNGNVKQFENSGENPPVNIFLSPDFAKRYSTCSIFIRIRMCDYHGYC